jgi:hypothetical protein
MEDKIMKKLMNLTKKNLLTIEGGTAFADFTQTTASSAYGKLGIATTNVTALGDRSIKAFNYQRTSANRNSVRSCSCLKLSVH